MRERGPFAHTTLPGNRRDSGWPHNLSDPRSCHPAFNTRVYHPASPHSGQHSGRAGEGGWPIQTLSLPPTPMQAMFSTSFGPTPPAHPCRPLAKTPNPATEAPYRNDRRLTDAIMAKFSSVSLECPIATRHSFNDQMGEAYRCILRKPFPPSHIPARDANIKKTGMFLLRIMIGSILGVIRLGCLQQCLGDSSNGRI